MCLSKINVNLLTFVWLAIGYAHAQYFNDYLRATTHTGFRQQAKAGLVSVYEARNLEFSFPSENERQRVLKNGLYNPEGVTPIDVDVYYPHDNSEPTIFLTIPRFSKGVPYSLAHLTNEERPNGKALQAYPSYDWHKSHGADCNGLTSVYRVQIDICGRIWILDSGEIDFVHYCPPQLIAIDLASGQVLHRYRLPKAMYKQNVSRFVTPTIDVDPHTCTVGFVYLADSIGDAIVVYDLANEQSWRIENKYTYPNPDFGTFTIAGDSFELWDGTVGLTLTPRQLAQRRMLYFHSLSSDWQIEVPLDVVNNASNFKLNDVSAALSEFVLLGKRGSQCVASAISDSGVLLCGLVQPSGIHGWNVRTPFTRDTAGLLLEDREKLQFASGLKVVKNHDNKEEIWVLSNRLQKAFGVGLDFKQINFRIQKCLLEDLLAGKACIS